MFTNLPLEKSSYIKAIKIRIGLYNKKFKNKPSSFISICNNYINEVYAQYADDDMIKNLCNGINKKYFDGYNVIKNNLTFN